MAHAPRKKQGVRVADGSACGDENVSDSMEKQHEVIHRQETVPVLLRSVWHQLANLLLCSQRGNEKHFNFSS